MRNLNFAFLTLSIATLAILGTTQGAFAVETPLTDYSRAVILENPIYYWTFNETGDTTNAQEVMRYETQAQMIPILDAERVDGYSAALGQAASFNNNAAFWAEMVNRGKLAGAYAVEYWVKADVIGAGDGLGSYIANFSMPGGDSPGIIHNFSLNQTALWYGGVHTGSPSQLNFNDGQWHHVVMAVNADGVKGTADQFDFAVDGVVVTNATAIDALRLNLGGALVIGACKPVATPGVNGNAVAGPDAGGVWDAFDGKVDEFAIYDLAGMDTTQVAAKVASLAGHYNLATAPVEITPFAAVAANEVSYSFVGGNQVSPDYPDSTGSELSDGLYAGNGTAGATGFYGAAGGAGYTELEFNLGEVKTLDAVWISNLSGGNWGINAPASVELSFSTDGTNFSNTVTFDDFNNTSCPQTDPKEWDNFNERLSQIDVASVDAQYVRTKFNYNGVFVFLTEVQFMEEVEQATAWTPGDANKDGKVDGSDVTILAGNWQKLTDATWDMGDFNGDGKVDGSDVTILAGNWQAGVSTAAASVPEPGTIVLLISAIASLLVWRRVR